MEKKGKNKGGRPPVYDPDRSPGVAGALARNGESQQRIAQIMGLSYSTIKKWAKEHAEFSAALRETREEADATVERSLYQRACGYEYEETEIVGNPGKDGKLETKRIKKNKKRMAPDVMAAMFWLRNRQPGRYKEKPEDLRPASLVRVRRMIMPAKPVAGAVPTSGEIVENSAQPVADNALSGGADGGGRVGGGGEDKALGEVRGEGPTLIIEAGNTPSSCQKPNNDSGEAVGGGEGAVCPA